MTDPPARASMARYRQILAAHGFRPSKTRGQNFLLDPSLHRWIVDAAEVGPGDLVLEVGAGLGFLTRELAARAARVVAVEVDTRLYGILAEELSGLADLGDVVRLVRMDALRKGVWNPDLLEILAAERVARPASRLLLVANLPYSIAGPFLAGVPTLEEPPACAAVMVQEDMARRICASPGTAAYGGLSVVLQAAYEARLARRVGADVFWPRPRVGSAVVTLVRRAESPLLALDVPDRVGFGRFVRALFGQRRKQLGNALPPALRLAGRALPADLPPALRTRRPGALEPPELLAIWNRAPGLS